MVIRSAYNDRINLSIFFVDHFSIVGVSSSVLESSFRAIQVVRIDIAEGHDVLASDSIDVSQSPIRRSDTGDDKFLIR